MRFFFNRIDFFENFSAEKAGKLVSIYKTVPIGGVIETGSVELNKERVLGELLIKDNKDDTVNFNIDGLIDFNLNKKIKWFFLNPKD